MCTVGRGSCQPPPFTPEWRRDKHITGVICDHYRIWSVVKKKLKKILTAATGWVHDKQCFFCCIMNDLILFFFSESSCWLDWSWEHLTIWRLCLPVAHSKQWCEMTALKAFCSCLINWKVITWRQEVLFVNEDVWLLIRPPERVMLSTRRIKAHQAQSWRILFWSRVHGVNLEVRDGKRIIVS